MGADENAAIVRRGYEAFNSGDMKTLTELFDESASWHTPGRSSLAGDYEGRDASFAYFGRLGQETGGTFRAELQHLLADEATAWSASIAAARSETASTWMLSVCLVFQLKDGRITDGREHFDDLYAWDEFWS